MIIDTPIQARFRLFAAGFCVLFVTTVSQAEERRHDAHEHGVSEAKLALDGNVLDIELHSPGADIVGFEHAPSTKADKLAIAKAAAILSKGAQIFAPTAAAGCNLIDADIDAPGKSADRDGKDHDHGHGHGHKGKRAEKHGHNVEKHTDDGHAEFKAHYRFRCQNPDKLTHIDVKLFEYFPSAREMSVQAITRNGQFVRELKPGSARLAL